MDDHLKFASLRKRRIISMSGVLSGEPVFKGTRISVRHVGELAKKGVPLGTLLEDFPRLSEPEIEFARKLVSPWRDPPAASAS